MITCWTASLDCSRHALAGFNACLSAEERERSRRFRFDRDRDRFVAGRGILRTILGRHLDVPPAEVTLTSRPLGKPALGGDFADADLEFNLAHCEDFALVAVARAGEVGIDLERIRPLEDADDLVARFFSPRENKRFQSLPDPLKPAAFFNLWTRKEAWLKATGLGIGHLLDQVEVTFVPGEPARLLRIPEIELAQSAWELYELFPAPGFVAALAARGSRGHVECRSFGPRDVPARSAPIANHDSGPSHAPFPAEHCDRRTGRGPRARAAGRRICAVQLTGQRCPARLCRCGMFLSR